MEQWPTIACALAVILSLSLPANAVTVWTGAIDVDWDTFRQNWVDEFGRETSFTNGDSVLFGDTGLRTTVVIADPTVRVAKLTFTSPGYVINGPDILSIGDIIEATADGLNATINANVLIRAGTERDVITSLAGKVLFTGTINGRFADDWLADAPPAVPLPPAAVLLLTALLGWVALGRRTSRGYGHTEAPAA